MVAANVIKSLLVLGIICWIFDSSTNKTTLQDVKDDLTGFRGITAPLFWGIYILTVLMMLLMYPFITGDRITNKLINKRRNNND